MIEPTEAIDPKKFSIRLNNAFDLRMYPSLGQGRISYVQEIFNISRAGANKWLHGKAIPHKKKRVEIAEKLAVNLTWLETGKGDSLTIDLEKLLVTNQLFEIPLLTAIDACHLEESLKKTIKYKKILISNLQSKDIFAIKAQGLSMFPKIMDGTLMLINPNQSINDGDIVLATTRILPEAICRQYIVGENTNYLVAVNPKFDTIIVDSSVKIIGKVIEIRIEM